MDPITRQTHLRLLAVLLLAGMTHPARAATRYLTIINDDDRAIVLIEMSVADTRSFAPLDIPSPLIGGRDGQATAVVPAGPCRRDLRIVYRDASTLTVTGWDSCHQSMLHVGAARRAALLTH